MKTYGNRNNTEQGKIHRNSVNRHQRKTVDIKRRINFKEKELELEINHKNSEIRTPSYQYKTKFETNIRFIR